MNLLDSGYFTYVLSTPRNGGHAPFFVGLYELLFAPGARHWRMMALAGALTIPYVFGKLTGEGSLIENPAYQLSISPGRFLDSFHLYLNPLLYQDHWFRDSNTVQLSLGMLVFGILMKSRSMLFAWCFLLLSILPVSFIAHYAAFFLYIPLVGWVLYAAEVLVAVRRKLAEVSESLFSPAVFVVLIAAVLAPAHASEGEKTFRHFSGAQPPTAFMAAELERVVPCLPKGGKVLFVDDPFPKQDYSLLFLTRLVYDDLTIEVTRCSSRERPAGSFDAVLVCHGGRLTVEGGARTSGPNQELPAGPPEPGLN